MVAKKKSGMKPDEVTKRGTAARLAAEKKKGSTPQRQQTAEAYNAKGNEFGGPVDSSLFQVSSTVSTSLSNQGSTAVSTAAKLKQADSGTLTPTTTTSTTKAANGQRTSKKASPKQTTAKPKPKTAEGPKQTSSTTPSSPSPVSLDAAIKNNDAGGAAAAIAAYAKNHSQEEVREYIQEGFKDNEPLLGEVSKKVKEWDEKTRKAFLDATEKLIDPSKGLAKVTIQVADSYQTNGFGNLIFDNKQFGEDLRDAIRATPQSALDELLVGNFIAFAIAVIGQLGKDHEIGGKDTEAIEKVLVVWNGISDEKLKTEVAFLICEKLGAEYLGLLLEEMRKRSLLGEPYGYDRAETVNVLENLGAVASYAMRDPSFGLAGNCELTKFVKTGPFEQVAMLVFAPTGDTSSELIALVGSSVLLNRYSATVSRDNDRSDYPSVSAREIVLAAFAWDQQEPRNGNAAETYLFASPKSVLGSSEERRDALLLKTDNPVFRSETTKYVADDSDVAGEVFQYGVLTHWAKGFEQDVVNYQASIINSEHRGGGDTTKYGKFALATIFATIISDSEWAESFGDYCNSNGGSQKFGQPAPTNQNYEAFIGNIAKGKVKVRDLSVKDPKAKNAYVEISNVDVVMGGLAGYLAQSKEMLNSPSTSAAVIGWAMYAIQKRNRDDAHSQQQLAELLLTMVLTVAVASTGAYFAAGVTAVSARAIIAGVTELSKSASKSASKKLAEEWSGGGAGSVNEAVLNANRMFTVAVFSGLSEPLQRQILATTWKRTGLSTSTTPHLLGPGEMDPGPTVTFYNHLMDVVRETVPNFSDQMADFNNGVIAQLGR
jgi:hypothetical protein